MRPPQYEEVPTNEADSETIFELPPEHPAISEQTASTANGQYISVSTSDNVEEEAASTSQPNEASEADSLANSQVVYGYDGVFATMSAKPEAAKKKLDDPNSPNADENLSGEAPPEYNEVANDSAPPYFDTTIITTLDSDEILVEGLPVGSVLSFFTTMLVSMSFQFVGFLLTYLLSTTWAGRRGSTAGFGVTLLHYGLYLRTRIQHFMDPSTPPFPSSDDDLSFPPNVTPEERAAVLARTEWLAYLLMLIGWFMVIRSCTDYIRVRRLQHLIMSHPEGFAV